MASLREIVEFIDRELSIAEIPDYPGAVNGLQLEGKAEIGKVAAAVDASLPVIEKAVAAGADLLLVHHGMFWNGTKPYTGALYQKLKIAMESGLAIYSAHLPLDVHAEWGNNACLVRALALEDVTPFFDWKGIALGLRGKFPGSREALLEALAQSVGGEVHLCPGGSEEVGVVGVITGGAGAEVDAVAKSGIDTFITGEGPHWSYPLAEELGVNVLYGGHYATETFGVKALAAALQEQFAVEWVFLDHPTGL